MKAEYIELLEAGAIFNPDWLARIEHLRALRFMDWMATNNSTARRVGRPPALGDYTYGWRGAPVEVMVALANETGADPWFTLPHQATDELLPSLCRVCPRPPRSAPQGLCRIFERGLELVFGQAHWAQAAGRGALGRGGGGDAWIQFAGMRAAQMADDLGRGLRRRAPTTGWSR